MEKKAKDLYFIAVKVFLKRGNTFFVFKDGFGQWDLPGGRVRYDEFRKPFEAIIKRKMKEEVGSNVKYKLGKPFIFMRHERKERTPHGTSQARIFAIGYEAKFLSGNVTLPSHHIQYEWMPIKTFKPEKYFNDGWLDGVKTYLAIKRK